MSARKKKSPIVSERSQWEAKFIEKMAKHHRKNVPALAKRYLKRLDGIKNSMVARSKKYDVPCTITIDDIRKLAYDAYGTECRYTKRLLTHTTMVFDHRIPISKGGPSTVDNIQIISKLANGMKGSLLEEDFFVLLNWLDSIPEHLAKDIRVRLARGVV